MFLKAVMAALLFFSPTQKQYPNVPAPAMNLTAIDSIYCNSSEGEYEGTGFIVGPNTLVTANHVGGGDGKCFDITANTPLKMYRSDKKHDLVVMTGDLKPYGPFIHYNCERPRPGTTYISYGWSPINMPDFNKLILRNNPIIATRKMTTDPNLIPGFADSRGMRGYIGAIAPGTSGGPVADLSGNVVAINNAGDNRSTLEFDLADTGLCTGSWDR